MASEFYKSSSPNKCLDSPSNVYNLSLINVYRLSLSEYSNSNFNLFKLLPKEKFFGQYSTILSAFSSSIHQLLP